MTTEGTILRVHVAATHSGMAVVADVLFDGHTRMPAPAHDATHRLMALLYDPTAGADLYALTARLLGEQAAEAGATLAALEGRRVRADVGDCLTYINMNTVEVLPVSATDARAPTVLRWRPISELPENWRDPERTLPRLVFVWDHGLYNGWPLSASLNGNDDGTVWETNEHAHKLGGVRWWALCPLSTLPPS